MVEAYLEALEEGYFEATEAFKGLQDDHVWKRPAEGLLSIGEISGHVAYWEAIKFAGEIARPRPDLSKCLIKSPLIDHHFHYYDATISQTLPQELLTMTAAQVEDELLRVHKEAMTNFKALAPDIDSAPPGWSPSATYRAFLRYACFHVAYHTGQIYSARHILGENPPDN